MISQGAFKKIGDVPANIRRHGGKDLTLEQANRWADFYENFLISNSEKASVKLAWLAIADKYNLKFS